MAPRKDDEVLEGSAESGSTDTTSNAGSSTELKDPSENSEFTSSCVAILEPSEDDPLFKRERIRRPYKTYKAIMRSYNSTDVYMNSEEPSNDGESGQQTYGRRNVCIDLFNRYSNFAVKFRNSKFIYILQILSTLLPISAFVMGKKYLNDCPGSPDLTGITLFTALWSIVLIAMWIAIKCCNPEDRPCEGQQKCLILCIFIFITALLEIEIYKFSKLSPNVDPSASNYCNKVFYDYTYYKFIAAFLTMLLVILLYFPGCSNFASGLTCAGPGNSCYQAMLEEDD